jgi:hypothetical protein
MVERHRITRSSVDVLSMMVLALLACLFPFPILLPLSRALFSRGSFSEVLYRGLQPCDPSHVPNSRKLFILVRYGKWSTHVFTVLIHPGHARVSKPCDVPFTGPIGRRTNTRRRYGSGMHERVPGLQTGNILDLFPRTIITRYD